MKTPILFGLLILLITACKKKDEPQIEEPDSPTQYELFIGNWDITSRSVDGISSLETLNETFVFTTSADGSQTEGTAIHSSDGYDNNLSFTLKASQDSIIFTKESGSTMRCYYEMFETHFTLRYQAEEGITQENWEKQ